MGSSRVVHLDDETAAISLADPDQQQLLMAADLVVVAGLTLRPQEPLGGALIRLLIRALSDPSWTRSERPAGGSSRATGGRSATHVAVKHA